MTGALTLSEAADRLANVLEEGVSAPAPAKVAKGKWMTLEGAAAVLSERVTGQAVAPKKKRAEVTVQQAAKQIEAPYVDLADLRSKRETATAKRWQSLLELEDFINRAVELFNGVDREVLAASPDFHGVCAYEQQLQDAFKALTKEEQEAWAKECMAENDVFEADRPDWSPADAKRIGAFLTGLGLSEQEMWQLWTTPEPINVGSPICEAIAQMVAPGSAVPVYGALAAVGFDAAEINAVVSGEKKVVLRDHRMQELVARAADANTPTEDRRAA